MPGYDLFVAKNVRRLACTMQPALLHPLKISLFIRRQRQGEFVWVESRSARTVASSYQEPALVRFRSEVLPDLAPFMLTRPELSPSIYTLTVKTSIQLDTIMANQILESHPNNERQIYVKAGAYENLRQNDQLLCCGLPDVAPGLVVTYTDEQARGFVDSMDNLNTLKMWNFQQFGPLELLFVRGRAVMIEGSWPDISDPKLRYGLTNPAKMNFEVYLLPESGDPAVQLREQVLLCRSTPTRGLVGVGATVYCLHDADSSHHNAASPAPTSDGETYF